MSAHVTLPSDANQALGIRRSTVDLLARLGTDDIAALSERFMNFSVKPAADIAQSSSFPIRDVV